MTYGIEACALALLRADPEFAVPISRLYDALRDQAGPVVEASGPLQERLRRRPDLFILFEPRPAPWDLDEWPDRIRQEYRTALRDAGLAPEPRVAPRPPPPTEEGGTELDQLLRQVNDSLVDLWDAIDDDPDARSQVADALGEGAVLSGALRATPPGAKPGSDRPERGHPTTPPRGPRSGG